MPDQKLFEVTAVFTVEFCDSEEQAIEVAKRDAGLEPHSYQTWLKSLTAKKTDNSV